MGMQHFDVVDGQAAAHYVVLKNMDSYFPGNHFLFLKFERVE